MPVPFSPDTGSSPDCWDVVLVPPPRLVGLDRASMIVVLKTGIEIGGDGWKCFLGCCCNWSWSSAVREEELHFGYAVVCNVDVPFSTMTSAAG